MHAGHIEVAVSKLIGYRSHIIVPNVSWGWGLNHEADLIVVDKNQKVTEIEIKVSLSDLKRDFQKPNQHRSKKIGRLVYAIPESILEKALPLIPKEHGIIIVRKNTIETWFSYRAIWQRRCRYRKDYAGISNAEVHDLMRLATMRIWSLKEHNNGKVRS